MNLRRAFSVLTGVALLGAIAAYIESARSPAAPSERVAPPVANAKPADTKSAEAKPANAKPADAPRAVTRTADAALDSPPSQGNPLWALPLKQLSSTQQRPIFSPSRRPPPPATPTYVAPVAVRQAPKPTEPERPAVALLGTIIGSDDRIAGFLETATGNFVRMRVGDDHQGWVVRLIKAREVTLVKDRDQVVVLELPPPGDSPMMGAGMMPGGIPGGMPGGMPNGIPGVATGMPNVPGTMTGLTGLPGRPASQRKQQSR